MRMQKDTATRTPTSGARTPNPFHTLRSIPHTSLSVPWFIHWLLSDDVVSYIYSVRQQRSCYLLTFEHLVFVRWRMTVFPPRNEATWSYCSILPSGNVVERSHWSEGLVIDSELYYRVNRHTGNSIVSFKSLHILTYSLSISQNCTSIAITSPTQFSLYFICVCVCGLIDVVLEKSVYSF